jgi:hypothetical protein
MGYDPERFDQVLPLYSIALKVILKLLIPVVGLIYIVGTNEEDMGLAALFSKSYLNINFSIVAVVVSVVIAENGISRTPTPAVNTTE